MAQDNKQAAKHDEKKNESAAPVNKTAEFLDMTPHEFMRYELAKSAIGGVALHHQIEKVNLISDAAIRLADSVLEALEKPKS